MLGVCVAPAEVAVGGCWSPDAARGVKESGSLELIPIVTSLQSRGQQSQLLLGHSMWHAAQSIAGLRQSWIRFQRTLAVIVLAAYSGAHA